MFLTLLGNVKGQVSQERLNLANIKTALSQSMSIYILQTCGTLCSTLNMIV